MRDAQIIHELKGIHAQIDNLSNASNTQTQAISELLITVRAIQNLINRSWLLSRLCGLNKHRVEEEMNRVNEQDIKLRNDMYEKVEEQKRKAAIAEKKKAEQRRKEQMITKREKQLERKLRRKGVA